jgi:hypothetical protein
VTGLSLFGESISVAAINREALQQRFGFIAEPQPEAQAKPL